MVLATHTPLISAGTFTGQQVFTAVVSQEPRTEYTDLQVREIVDRTIHWCRTFGFNWDLVLSQMLHETGWFRYGGDVQPDQWNFAGLGATGGVPGHRFPDIEAGVRAVVAHHAVYRWGREEDWPEHLRHHAGNHVDPRYQAVLSTGNAGRMIELGDYRGTWAVPGTRYPEAIIRTAQRIATYPTGEEPPMVADDPRFQWIPDVSEFGYPPGTHGRGGKPIDYLIVHVTEGTDSSSWLRGGNGSSTHYLTHRDATPREQHVREADAAWTAGSREYNQRGINIEFERFARDDWTDEEYHNAAETCLPILKRHNIPLVFLGRQSAGRRGILGHVHIPDGEGGWGGSSHHTDPGEKFDFNRFILGLKALEVKPEDEQLVIAGNPHGEVPIVRGFRQLFLDCGSVKFSEDPVRGGLSLFGYPLAAEEVTNFGSQQLFERVVMRWESNKARPFNLVMELRQQD